MTASIILRVGDLAFESQPCNFGGFYSINYMGVYDPILTNLKPTDIVVDGGANIGVFSIMAARRARLVYAIEPDPVNFEYLCKNLRLNRIENVVPLNLALSDRNGQSRIQGTGEGAHLSSTGHTVHTTTLDDVSRDPITAVKLDIEGAEVMALMRMKSLASIRLLAAEIDQVHLDILNSDPEVTHGVTWEYAELLSHLRSCGFTIVMQNELSSEGWSKRFDRHTISNEIKTGLLGTRWFVRPFLSRGTNMLRPSTWIDNRYFFWMFYGFKDPVEAARVTYRPNLSRSIGSIHSGTSDERPPRTGP